MENRTEHRLFRLTSAALYFSACKADDEARSAMAIGWRGSRYTDSHLFLSTLQLAVHLPDRSRQYPASSEARRVSAGCATRARVTRTSTCCEEKLTMAVPFCRFAGQRASLAATGFLGGFFGGRPPGIYPIALPAAPATT